MTIKQRFLLSYIGGILIAGISILSIICILIYVTTGTIPTPDNLYQTLTKQRSLSTEEELAYIDLRSIAKSNPDTLISAEVEEYINQFEEESLGIVVRKDEKIMYYSQGLVEKSLTFHFPQFDANNIETKGTIDNAGSFYRYVKFDFYFSDQTKGSILILKKQNNYLDFMTRWGTAIILIILCISLAGVLFINYLLKRTIISPLENLGQVMSQIKEGELAASSIPFEAHFAKEIKQLTTNFENMREALIVSTEEQRNLENNRKELIASISHDLKTPITSIIGYVEGLIEGVATSPEKQEKYLRTIHTKSLALNHLIEELFLYSKLDAEAVPFHFERIDIIHFLIHMVEEARLSDNQAMIGLKVKEIVPLYVTMDRMQMSRAIMNLIENSIKFRKNDDSLFIQLELSEENEKIVLRVLDNGQGIPEQQLPYVFNHFYRGEEARTTETGGSGLGLAIVKQIVEKHNGEVQIQSQLNVGTTVSILLNKA